MPNFKKFNEQKREIERISKTIELESDYESKMEAIGQKLEEINWESKKQKIQVNFDLSPFFIPKIEVFFKDLIAKSGMTLGGISFGTSNTAEGFFSTTNSNRNRRFDQKKLKNRQNLRL